MPEFNKAAVPPRKAAMLPKRLPTRVSQTKKTQNEPISPQLVDPCSLDRHTVRA